MFPEFRAGERSTEITHICTECGAECGADFEWDDGSGYFCFKCDAEDSFRYDIDCLHRAAALYIRDGDWDYLGDLYAKMQARYDDLQNKLKGIAS